MQFLFSWVDTLASATTLLLQFNVIFVCQKKNREITASLCLVRELGKENKLWQIDKTKTAMLFVSIMWKRKEILLIFFSVKSRQKKIVKMTQCPVAYWSTPLTPEDRLRQLPNGKKTFKSFETFKIRKNWNCRWLKIQIRILESAQSFLQSLPGHKKPWRKTVGSSDRRNNGKETKTRNFFEPCQGWPFLCQQLRHPRLPDFRAAFSRVFMTILYRF